VKDLAAVDGSPHRDRLQWRRLSRRRIESYTFRGPGPSVTIPTRERVNGNTYGSRSYRFCAAVAHYIVRASRMTSCPPLSEGHISVAICVSPPSRPIGEEGIWHIDSCKHEEIVWIRDRRNDCDLRQHNDFARSTDVLRHDAQIVCVSQKVFGNPVRPLAEWTRRNTLGVRKQSTDPVAIVRGGK
jgi:hypothetical protein